MQEKRTIRTLRAHEEIKGVFLVAQASLQQSRNGPYWRVELRDATGSLEGKIWSPLSSSFSELPSGCFVQITGRTSLYRDQLQISVDSLRVLGPDEEAGLDMADFLPASARSGEDMLTEMEALCERELTHKPWRKFARGLLKDPAVRLRLLTAPAAKAVHHAYVGGLLEHSLSVAAICLKMAELYPQDIDRETLLCGALFHDIGKLEEMSGGLVTDYTDSGKMLGHIVQGLIMMEPHLRKSGLEPELALHFRHLVASHHGLHEYGSPSLPATAEAFILHYADNMDAKIVQIRGQFQEGEPGSPVATGEGDGVGASGPGAIAWSGWNSLLNRRLARAPRTPRPEAAPPAPKTPGKGVEKKPAAPASKEDQQCSLL